VTVRVLLVAEQLRRAVPGGIGTYIDGLLQGLSALGDEAPVLVLHASRAPRAGPDPLARRGRPVLASPLPGRLLTTAWNRGWMAAPGGFDAVHAPSLGLPPVRGGAIAVTVHDLAWRELPDAFPRRGRRWHEAALARAVADAHLFVVPSKRTADGLVTAGVAAGRVEVVEEGCDHLPPADVAGADALLARLGVRGGYLLAVGTLEPRKNLPRLVEAYGLARCRLPEPWPLVVVGPRGWGRSPLPPSPGVLLAGPVDPAVLAALYRRARCLAYVPLVEGFGLPPAEAMHECTPVVASPVPSTAAAALEVDPRDVRAIAAGRVAAAADDRVRAELVTAGMLRAGELRWESAARPHVELWAANGVETT
jgi:glycosyltransferase involved in cell wall biosynthesis